MRAIQCPRCGYVLRGTVESWGEACPLAGVCNECGLGFEWADLLSAKRRGPSWCAEHGRWWAFPPRAIATAALTFWPVFFWRSLRMHHHPRRGRLVAYLLALVAALYVPFVAGQGIRAWRMWPALSTIPAGPFGGNVLGPAPATAPLPRTDRLRYTAEAMIRPWVDTTIWTNHGALSLFTITRPTGVVVAARASPRTVLLLGFPWAASVHWPSLATIAAFPAIVACLMPLGFVTLPVSLRQARVRRSHLVRIWVYGLPYLLLPPWLVYLTLPRLAHAGHLSALEDRLALLCFVALPAVSFAWWGFAIRGHLKLRHPWGVSGALLAMAVLVPLACGYFWYLSVNWAYVLF